MFSCKGGAQADDGEVAEVKHDSTASGCRKEAKTGRRADAARDRLAEMGIILEDVRRAPHGGVVIAVLPDKAQGVLSGLNENLQVG